MATGPSRFVRDNAFIVAAVALPVLVGAFFLVASAIPRWTVPGPAFDLVMRVPRPYDATPNKVIVEFNVRDGRVEGTARPAPPDQGYSQRWALLYFDHTTMTVREIPFEQPASLAPGEESRPSWSSRWRICESRRKQRRPMVTSWRTARAAVQGSSATCLASAATGKARRS